MSNHFFFQISSLKSFNQECKFVICLSYKNVDGIGYGIDLGGGGCYRVTTAVFFLWFFFFFNIISLSYSRNANSIVSSLAETVVTRLSQE